MSGRFQFLGIPPKGELELSAAGVDPYDQFPISRDPPEGGTLEFLEGRSCGRRCFQFLGIPPKGELGVLQAEPNALVVFPISRDPPEGGTWRFYPEYPGRKGVFPISRDPPEGGTLYNQCLRGVGEKPSCFQFLGIPPKGELVLLARPDRSDLLARFQFLGIPPKGEHQRGIPVADRPHGFQFLGIPPKGEPGCLGGKVRPEYRSFQFLGIPPKGEHENQDHTDSNL